MRIVFNGEPREVHAPTLQALLRELELEGKKIAIELNRSIVPHAQYSSTPVAEGDEIEIVQFVGGG